MNIDGTILSTAIMAVAMGAGGFFTGRRTATSEAMSIASETVEMLQAQIELLQEDKNHKESELADLRNRIIVLEGLVTQRAEVEELTVKVSLVKETVDRIADKVGA